MWGIINWLYGLFSNSPLGEWVFNRIPYLNNPLVRRLIFATIRRVVTFRILGSFSVLLIALVVFGFLLRPMIHGELMWVLTHPISWIIDVAGVIFVFYRWRFKPFLLTEWQHKSLAMGVILTLFFVLDNFIFTFFEAAYGKQALALDQTYTQMTILPDTHQVRWLPYEVAKRYGDTSMQDPTLQLGEFHAFDKNGEISWVAPQEPKGLYNWIANKSDGFKQISPDGKVKTFHQLLTYGEGMCCLDNIRWQLIYRHYWMEVGEIYYQAVDLSNNSDPEVIAIAPYVDYYLHFPLVLPKWGGVFVIHGDGTIEDLSPEQAQQDPRFLGERLYPSILARIISDAWAWKEGPSNYYTSRKGVTEIPRLEGGTSQFSFLIPTEVGAYFFTALQPAGTGQGINKMMFSDAHSGALQLYEFPVDSNRMGPNGAKGFLRKEYPGFNWTTADDRSTNSGNIAIEPRPVFKDQTAYWMISVTTKDFSGVEFAALIDTDQSDQRLLPFQSPGEIQAFLDQGVVPVHESADLSQVSTIDLINQVQQFVEELKRRNTN